MVVVVVVVVVFQAGLVMTDQPFSTVVDHDNWKRLATYCNDL